MNRTLSPILKEILETQTVIDQEGQRSPLKYSIDINEGFFLQEMLARVRPRATIEIGCGHGISTAFICEELARVSPEICHLILDPSQTTGWQGKGLTTLKRAGLKNFELLEELSELALPKLLAAGRRFDFSFIDGWHTFDHTLLDFFYLNRMLNVNGVIVFDDVGYPSIRKCVRYLSNYPAYRVLGQVNADEPSWKWRLLDRFRSLAGILISPLGRRLCNEFFDQRLLASDHKLQINASMIALLKVSEDERSFDWYKPF